MSAWCTDNFSNDMAAEWVAALEKSKGIKFLMSPIERINQNTGYLKIEECSEALAASEVVAAAISSDYSITPDKVRTWLNTKKGFIFAKKPQINPEHSAQAITVVERILKESELRELWQDSEEFENWQEKQHVLLKKLRS